MSDDIDPDFEQRAKFIQPQTRAFRAPYRSPIDSEELNLHHNSVAQDIKYLYEKLEEIDADLKERFKSLYEIGSIEFSDDSTLNTITDYASALRYLRQEVDNLK